MLKFSHGQKNSHGQEIRIDGTIRQSYLRESYKWHHINADKGCFSLSWPNKRIGFTEA